MGSSSRLFRNLYSKGLALVAACAIQLAVPVAVGAAEIAPPVTPSFTPESLSLSPQQIISRLSRCNHELQTYQSHVRMEFRLRSFPYIRDHIEGTASFQRPSRYQIDFKRVPAYAKGFSHLTADLADAASWERRFVVTVVGSREVNGHQDIVLRLVQRIRGQIDHQDVAVNPSLWEVDAMEYYYYNGGVISMQQHFENIGRFRLITSQDAQIHIPYVKAVAHADYTDYRTNVALSLPSADPRNAR
jgi:hypothetical protein